MTWRATARSTSLNLPSWTRHSGRELRTLVAETDLLHALSGQAYNHRQVDAVNVCVGQYGACQVRPVHFGLAAPPLRGRRLQDGQTEGTYSPRVGVRTAFAVTGGMFENGRFKLELVARLVSG